MMLLRWHWAPIAATSIPTPAYALTAVTVLLILSHLLPSACAPAPLFDPILIDSNVVDASYRVPRLTGRQFVDNQG